MFKKALLSAVCVTSFCFADNFIIDQQSSGRNNDRMAEHAEEQNKLPQRVVIEDINPSSELGQLVGTMLKNEQKKAVVAATPKPKPVVKKKAKKKKPIKKKKVTKAAKKESVSVNKEIKMEIKSEEASKVGEPEKKDAEHNENNSSLKKLSSSSVCNN